MKIFPAIDIKDKKCVRLVKGDFDNKTEYAISPVDQASRYKGKEGKGRVTKHIVFSHSHLIQFKTLTSLTVSLRIFWIDTQKIVEN